MNHVLIVDDEAEIRESLESILREEDYLVTTAATAAEALELLRDAAYDVVLLDIWLPDRDGLDTLTEIRQMESANVPEVIIISGHGTIEVRGARHQARRLRLPRKASLARPHPHRPQERDEGPPDARGQPGVLPPARAGNSHRETPSP